MDDAANQRNAAQLEGLVDDTSALSSQLKNRITKLAKQGAPGQEGRTRAEQVGTRATRSLWMGELTVLRSWNLDSTHQGKIHELHPELSGC
jgi:hypothetical protein